MRIVLFACVVTTMLRSSTANERSIGVERNPYVSGVFSEHRFCYGLTCLTISLSKSMKERYIHIPYGKLEWPKAPSALPAETSFTMV